MDARLDDREPARERDRSGHRISDAEPDRQMDREIGEGLDQVGGHGPSPAAANPAKLRTVRNKRQRELSLSLIDFPATPPRGRVRVRADRKSTRLNSSH